MQTIRHFKTVTLIAATALIGASACSVSPIKRHTYSYSITSNPSGARAVTGKGRDLGVTPLHIEQEYEQREFEAFGWPYLLASVGLFSLGGFSLASTDISESGEPLPVLLGGLSIGAGIAVFTLGMLASVGAFDSTQVRPVGSPTWSDLDKNAQEDQNARDQQIAKALFGPVWLRAPGYKDELVSVKNGGDVQVAMVAGQSGVGAFASGPVAPARPERPSIAATPETSANNPRAGTNASSVQFVTASPQPTAFALVVGIESYRDISAPIGARSDAEQFARMLQTSMGVPQKNIRLLTDQNATRSDILAQANWLKKNVPSGGRIYFYFSGHGSPDVETGHSYILPYEASPEFLKDTGVQLSTVLDRLGKSDAKEVLAFVDSCFSGSGGRSLLPEGTRPLVPVKEVAQKPKVALFSAAAASQISGNVPGKDAGLFTSYVLDGLGRGKADADGNGQVSLVELQRYVQPRVARVAKQSSRDQTPRLSFDDALGTPEHVIVTWGLPLQ